METKKDGAKNVQDKAAPANQPKPVGEQISLLEEDDEFEEFENGTWINSIFFFKKFHIISCNLETWTKEEEEQEQSEAQWVDDWDDEQVDDDFSKQLRAELEKDKGLQPMKD